MSRLHRRPGSSTVRSATSGCLLQGIKAFTAHGLSTVSVLHSCCRRRRRRCKRQGHDGGPDVRRWTVDVRVCGVRSPAGGIAGGDVDPELTALTSTAVRLLATAAWEQATAFGKRRVNQAGRDLHVTTRGVSGGTLRGAAPRNSRRRSLRGTLFAWKHTLPNRPASTKPPGTRAFTIGMVSVVRRRDMTRSSPTATAWTVPSHRRCRPGWSGSPNPGIDRGRCGSSGTLQTWPPTQACGRPSRKR